MADRAETLANWDRRHVWHPFTQMREWAGTDPVVIERGEGNCLFDTRGKRWLDGIGSIWTNVHGHRKRELDEALIEQIGKVAHSTLLGLSNAPAAELAAKLAAVAPGGPGALPRVFYSDNGATAVEVALKMAFQYWAHRGRKEKTRFLRFDGSYHGDTLGAVSVGGIDLYHAAFRPLLFPSIGVPNPYPLRGRDEAACLAALERLFDEHGKNVAALLIEPRVQGAAGILVSSPAFLSRMRALCDEHEVLLIADEVATGFGRTGPMWAVESADVRPDLLCVAKGISGGYLPLAATLATEEVYEAFLGGYEEQKTFFHGHTYTGNPLACAVGIASLALFESEKILARNVARTAYLATRLARLADHPHVADIRQAGFLVGIELVPSRKPLGEYAWEKRVGVKACVGAREKGVLLRPLGNVVVLNPPLSITESEIDWLVDATAHGIEAATAS